MSLKFNPALFFNINLLFLLTQQPFCFWEMQLGFLENFLYLMHAVLIGLLIKVSLFPNQVWDCDLY